jgi:hypothetical protein
MPRLFTPETSIFETIEITGAAVPKNCILCSTNPPTFSFRFGELSGGIRTGHCCTPCAYRSLMEMAERSARGSPRSQGHSDASSRRLGKYVSLTAISDDRGDPLSRSRPDMLYFPQKGLLWANQSLTTLFNPEHTGRTFGAPEAQIA